MGLDGGSGGSVSFRSMVVVDEPSEGSLDAGDASGLCNVAWFIHIVLSDAWSSSAVWDLISGLGAGGT